LDHCRGDGKRLAARLCEYRLGDRECERQEYRECCLLACFGRNLDASAYAGDVVADHIKPDTASGEPRYFVGGRQTRSEDELDRFSIA